MPIFEKNCPNSNQIKAARALLGWDQIECSKTIQVSLSSIRRYEKLSSIENPYDYLRASVVERVKLGLESNGIEFENDDLSIGVLLKSER